MAQHERWITFGKFNVPVKQDKGKLDVYHLCEEMSEGILNRLVRAQLSKAEERDHWAGRPELERPLRCCLLGVRCELRVPYVLPRYCLAA